MRTKLPLFFLLAELFTAGTVYALNYFSLPAYAIAAGLRFHAAIFLPAILLFFVEVPVIGRFKEAISQPRLHFSWLLSFVIGAGLYLLGRNGVFTVQKPDYLFELGLSSVADSLLYLLFNLPQLALLYVMVCEFRSSGAGKWLLLLFYFLMLLPVIVQGNFKPEMYPFLVSYVVALFCAWAVSLFTRDVLTFAVRMFLLFWLPFLLFGTDSKLIINLLFARNFESWDGFLTLKHVSSSYLAAGLMVVELVIFRLLDIGRKAQND